MMEQYKSQIPGCFRHPVKLWIFPGYDGEANGAVQQLTLNPQFFM
jgi:hypothetical protein